MAPPLSHKSGGQGSCAPTSPKVHPHSHNAKIRNTAIFADTQSTEHISHDYIMAKTAYVAGSLSQGPLYAASGAPGESVYSEGMRN